MHKIQLKIIPACAYNLSYPLFPFSKTQLMAYLKIDLFLFVQFKLNPCNYKHDVTVFLTKLSNFFAIVVYYRGFPFLTELHYL